MRSPLGTRCEGQEIVKLAVCHLLQQPRRVQLNLLLVDVTGASNPQRLPGLAATEPAIRLSRLKFVTVKVLPHEEVGIAEPVHQLALGEEAWAGLNLHNHQS